MATTTFEKNIYLDESAAQMLANMLDKPVARDWAELPSAQLLKGEELAKWFSCNFQNSPKETSTPDS